MLLINGLTDLSKQIIRLQYNNQALILELYFAPSINRWFLSLEYRNKKINNLMVVDSINLLKQFNLGFGLMVNCKNGSLPVEITNFTDGNTSLYILEPDDLKEASKIKQELRTKYVLD